MVAAEDAGRSVAEKLGVKPGMVVQEIGWDEETQEFTFVLGPKSLQLAKSGHEIPVGTVMSRLHRGRRMLKSRLYEHARLLGIIGPESAVGEDGQRDSVIDMDLYRTKTKKGATA